MKHFANVAACNYELSKKVEQIISDGNMCLTLGGDHSIGKKFTSLAKLWQTLFEYYCFDILNILQPSLNTDLQRFGCKYFLENNNFLKVIYVIFG